MEEQLPKPTWRERLTPNTVRSQVTRLIIGFTTLSLALVGALLATFQNSEIHDAVESHLAHSEDEVRQFAVRFMAETANLDAVTIDDFIVSFLQSQFPVEHESMAGFINGAVAYDQGSAQASVQDDAALSSAIQNHLPVSKTLWTEIATPTAKYLVLAVPVQVADGSTGEIVFAHDLSAEHEPLKDFMLTYAGISVAIIFLGGVLAWISTGYVMQPLTELRRLTTEISEHNLDERLPEDAQTADLAAVSRSFNSMVDRMQRALRSQYQLLDDAGHELRTPVTIVSGHLELMDVDDPADVAHTRDLALSELERMKRLTNDLVLLAKTERPDFLRVGRVDVADLTHEAFVHARTLGNREFVLGQQAHAVIGADGQRLLQAYLQLTANAVKFSELGSTITISSQIRGSDVVLSVKDEGIGIDPANREKIFARFAQVGSNDGAGLGLAIVSGIANAHGGSVELESELGQGSTFSVVIPLGKTTPRFDNDQLDPNKE